MRTPRLVSSRAGFSLLELMIGVLLLLMLVGSLTQSLASMSRGATYASLDGELQGQGENAMRAILRSLKRSGFANLGLVAYPYVDFVDGTVGSPDYANCAHPAPTHHASAGDPDAGANREIVFLQPADLDGDGRPDIDGNGAMIWSVNQHSFVVVTRPDGVNVLQHRIDGGSPKSIANHVERVTFDDSTTSGGVVPLNAIRVRIWFRSPDERGAIHRFFTEAIVKLRNG